MRLKNYKRSSQHIGIMENSIIALIFIGAVVYLGNIVRQNFSLNKKAGCPKGCGSCSAIDVDKIMEEHQAVHLSN